MSVLVLALVCCCCTFCLPARNLGSRYTSPPDSRECAWRMGTLQPSKESCWCQVCWLQSSNHLAPDDQKPKFLATMVIIIPCVAHDPDHDKAGAEHGLWRTPPGPQRGQGGTRDSLPSECYPANWCQYWCRHWCEHWCEHWCRQRCWHRVGAGAVTGVGGGISSGVGTGANTRVWTVLCCGLQAGLVSALE